ncbi:hypothetical protein [Helicobacter bizzozeronii]|uniref:hypothetical protein n=2 Tax=Helicobacter bizzozeronii TaxID=56877 RepID=UPI0013154488|nr:hypothetical protein [Helicobacter bizzozeronii]
MCETLLISYEMMDMNEQKKNLMQRLKRLQALIDAETDTTFRDALNREKTECLEQIMGFATQQTSPPQLLSSTQEQTTPTPLMPATTEPIAESNTQQEPQATEAQVLTQDKQKNLPAVISEKYVSFHNDVNSVSLGKLGALETNLLFAIFHKLKEKQMVETRIQQKFWLCRILQSFIEFCRSVRTVTQIS